MAKAKKLFSLLLCLILIVGLFPTAYAESGGEGITAAEEHDHEHDHEDCCGEEGVLEPVSDETPEDGIIEDPGFGEDNAGLVRVEFLCEPEDALITVYDPSQLDENGEPLVIDPEEDGTWLLVPGEYLYDAEREGYYSVRKGLKVEQYPLSICVRIGLTNKTTLYMPEHSDSFPGDAHMEGLSPSQVIQQIKNTYSSALSKSGRSSFNGYCGSYVNWQLVVLGINSDYVGADGNTEFDTYKNATETSGGFPVHAYPASSYSLETALNTISVNGTVDVYNVLIGFEQGSGEAGRLYGHTCFIHAIIGGTVYFSESYSGTICGSYHAEGDPISCSIDTFCSYYDSWTVLDGVIHFGTSTYLDKCNYYPSYLNGKTTESSYLKKYPCSSSTDSSSTDIVGSALPVGTQVLITGLYKNTVGNYWYKVKLTSGSYSGKEGFIYCPHISVTLKNDTVSYSGKDLPGSMIVGKTYAVDWTLKSTYLDITEVEGYIYGGANYSERKYYGHVSGLSTRSYNLNNTSVDNALLYNKLPEGRYKTEIWAYTENNYSQDGKTKLSSRIGYTPISFEFDEVPEGTHVHDKGEYLWTWTAHPHYKCYRCSVCGEEWADKNEPTYWVTCDQCRPGKPSFIGLEGAHSANQPVVFSWDATQNTTHYNIWVYKQNTSGEYEAVDHTFYVNSGYQLALDGGQYRALLQAYDSEHWEDDNSDWVHTESDLTYFTVQNTEGQCGNSLYWVLSDDKTLTIYGSGDMWDLTHDERPWASYAGEIQSVVVGSGATSIGSHAFEDFNDLISVTLPTSITRIATYGIASCESLTRIDIPQDTTEIEYAAFSNCSALREIVFVGHAPTIGAYAFNNVTATAYYPGSDNTWTESVRQNYGGTITWIPYGSYTVTYDANGGTGAPGAQTKTHDVDLTLSSKRPSRASTSAGSYTVTLDPNGGSVSSTRLTADRTTSYSFKNWNTAANGGGTSYAPGATYTANASVTLYAQWTESTSTSAVTLPTPTRTGYEFKGWASSTSATSGTTGSYTPTGNVTLHAIWEQSKPTITTQPTSISVQEGDKASFSVKAAGSDLTYQWYYRTSSTGSWTAVSSASGKTDTYSLTTAARHNGYQYRCKVSNSAGSVYSGIVTLTVTPAAPVITTQPASVSVQEGGKASFSVKATGSDLTYQWYYRTSSAGSWKAVSSASGKTADYSFTAAARHNGYQYQCMVSNAKGSAISNIVTLTVNPAQTKPVITTQPASTSGKAGETVRFSIKATGQDLSYQWYYRQPDASSWTAVSAASGKTANYSFTAAARHNGYRYKCVVSNSAGSTTSAVAILSVEGASPVILTQPKNTSVKEGAKARFTVQAAGTGLSYQWYYRTSAAGSWKMVSAASGKTANYSFTAAARHNGYQYQCMVSNAQGSVISSIATLTVSDAA